MKRKELSRGKKVALVLIVIAAAIIATYIVMACFFMNHFIFGTKIGGINAGGMSIEKFEQAMTEKIGGYTLTLKEREGVEETLAGPEINLSPDFSDESELEEIMENQSAFAWLAEVFSEQTYTVETVVVFDDLDTVLSGLYCMDESSYREPVDAYIGDYTEDEGYVIVPEDVGTTIDQTALYAAVEDAVTNLSETLDLDEAGVYVETELYSDSEELLSALETANLYASASITYTFQTLDPVVLEGSKLADLIKINGTKVSLKNQKIREWIRDLASSHNTIYRSRTFTTTAGDTITIDGGDYGWWMNTEEEISLLKQYIKAGETIEKEPEYYQRAKSYEGNDYGDTYVEVNLKAQHMYYYKDGELILESDFVSGNTSRGNGTPEGVYSITYKERDATLEGEDYSTPVSYWMPFNGNIGLHDASWRTKFGGDIYKTSGSHGCINLPADVAEELYGYIEKGDAVIVYD